MATKKWTVLVYLTGDNNLDEDGARDLAVFRIIFIE